MEEEKTLTEQESLDLIARTIIQAKGGYHDSGIGPILWGSIITLCSLVTFAEIQFGLKVPFDIWLLTLFAIAPQIFITLKERKERRVKKIENIAMTYIWTCFGISVFLLVNINANLVAQLTPIFNDYNTYKGDAAVDFNFSSYTSSLLLLLYGFPTIITGGITNLKPMLYGGIFCWICCVVTVYTDVKIDMILTALSAIAMWLIPGIILFRKNKMQQQQANV